MPMVTGRSGPGYAEASIPPWGVGGGGAAGGGGFTGAGGFDMGGMADLVRQAMLQKMDQSAQGFEEWKASRQQAREIAGAEEGRKKRGEKRGEIATKRASREMAKERTDAAPYQRRSRELAGQREAAETEAVTGRMPTRTAFGINWINPNARNDAVMTGAQRKAFLPEKNAMETSPDEAANTAGRASSDQAFESMLGEARAKQRAGLL